MSQAVLTMLVALAFSVSLEARANTRTDKGFWYWSDRVGSSFWLLASVVSLGFVIAEWT